MKKKQQKEDNVFQKIAEHWFLTEPVLFTTYCSHHLKPNGSITCTMRTGKGCIEYNPEQTSRLTEQAVEENLKAEMIRILLKHPYDRQPKECSAMACTLGSDCTLSSYYNDWKYIQLAKPSDFQLPEKEYFEWYAINIDKLFKKEGASSGSNSSEGKGNPTEGNNPTEGRSISSIGTNADVAKAKAEQSACGRKTS